jgi:hypothetical protein
MVKTYTRVRERGRGVPCLPWAVFGVSDPVEGIPNSVAQQTCNYGLTSHIKKLLNTITKNIYSSAPVSTGNTFQDLPRLREPADNTESYIQGDPKVSLHLMIAIQIVTSDAQSVPRQSPGPGGH